MTIPVFYSISDDFTPYAAVSLNSLVKFSDPAKDYTVVFLHQGLSADHRAALAAYSRSNVHIEFHEMSEDQLAPIQDRRKTSCGPISSPCPSFTACSFQTSSRNTISWSTLTATRS